MLACADNIAVAEGNVAKIEATVDTESKEDYSTQEVIEAMIGKDLPCARELQRQDRD